MPDLATQLQGAGFSKDEIGAYMTAQRSQLSAAGFNDDEINGYFGMPNDPKGVPQAMLQRIQHGGDLAKAVAQLPQAVTDIPNEAWQSTLDNVKDIAANVLPKGVAGGQVDVENETELQRLGQTGKALLDVASLPFAAIQGAVKSLVGHPIVAASDAVRAGMVKAVGEERTEQIEQRAAAAGYNPNISFGEAGNMVDTALMALGTKPLVRIGMGPAGTPEAVKIGGLPKGQDFTDAANAIGNGDATPTVEKKLQTLYEQHGIHPAEVAHDAQRDPTVAQAVLSSDKEELPAAYTPPERHGEPAFKPIEGIEGNTAKIVDDAAQRAMSREIVETPMPSGANSSKDLNGPVYVDPRVPEPLRRPVAVHETVEQELMAQGQSYDQAHQVATQAEKRAVEAAGMNWEEYTHQWDGLLSGIEHEKVSNLPPDLHVDLQEAIGHHGAKNKQVEPSEDILAERQPSSAGAAAGAQPSYSDAEKQILSKISIDEKSPTRALTWDQLYTGFLDKLYPIAKAVKTADLADLPTENNPYHLARLMAGSAGKADHFLNNGTFDFRTFENNGKPLKEILAPVADDLNGFRAYAAAARALELEGRGIKSGFDFAEQPSAPPLVSSGLDAARTVVVQGRDRFEKPLRELVDYQNRVSQYLRDSDVLSDAGYKAMLQANKLYVPFSRVMGIADDAAHIGGSSLQARNPIKAIKGSARDIVDPIESVVRNTYHMIEMAERNVVGTKLIDMLHGIEKASPDLPSSIAAETSPKLANEAPIADSLSEVGIKKPDELAQALAHATAPEREGQISILRDGKRETYSVDPELARAMKGLDAQSASMLERVLSAPASTLRAGAVMTPDFWGRHILRDFLYAATTFKGGVFHPVDMAKGIAGLVMKDEDYWNWMKGGGGNISSVGIDRRYLQENLRELTGQTGLAGRAWNVLTDPDASMWDKTAAVGKLPFQAVSKFVLDPLRAMTQFAENASHMGVFKKGMRAAEQSEEAGSLRDQILRSAWQSRDTAVDAARIGANMRAWNMITAFANIKLQDTDRVVRAIKDNPVSTLLKIGGAITAPSVILWAANHNDPRYAEIPQWQKDMFWLVMTPSHVFRIPKPWAMGMIFGTLPERMLDEYAGGKPNAFKDYIKDTAETLGPGFVPTAAAPIIDQFANRSTFTNRTLIPSAQEKFLPEYQYTPYTTQLARELGQIVGAFPGVRDEKLSEGAGGGIARAFTSPILIENYIRGWSGNLGMYALNAADTALRKQGILPDPPQPASTLADIPFVKAFVVRYPSASAQSIQDFYDAYNRAQAYIQTYQARARDGDAAAMQHIAMMGGPQAFLRLDGIARALGQQQKLVRDIYKNPQIEADQKRQLIDQLYFGMIHTAKAGNEAVAQATASLARK